MTRRFRDLFNSRDDGDDAALDALLAETWEDGVTAIASVLDVDGGKAALTAAPGRAEPPGTAGEAGVRELADTLLAIVTAEIGTDTGPAHSAISANLHACRQFLIQLRAGLAGRTLTKTAALDLTASLAHSLDEADRTVQHLPRGPGGQRSNEIYAVLGLIGEVQGLLPPLERGIKRLFDDASDPAPPIPAPTR